MLLSGQVTLDVKPRHGLEQIVLLLPNSLGFRIILACPFDQDHSLLFSLDGVLTGVRLPDSEICHLPGGRDELGDPLTSGSELHRQVLV
jgi:hypothetical protein